MKRKVKAVIRKKISSAPTETRWGKAGRTTSEVEAQIKGLQEIKPNVRHFSMFGDDHHNSIDIQIETLKEKYSDREIDNRDGEEWTADEASIARQARQWLDGELEDSSDLIESWKELVISG